MKKLIFLLISIILMVIIMFWIFKIFILQDLGKGALQVTSKPFSKVYLDGTYIGTSPLCRCEAMNMIRSGEYTVRLVPINGKTIEFQDKITISKGVLTVVDRKFGVGATSEGSIISLQALSDKKSSELLVITFPDKADVFIDANHHGASPYHLKSITDSDHTLRLKKEGYKDKSIRIRTPSGFKLVAVIYLGLQDNATKPAPLQPTVSGSPSVSPSITLSKLGKVIILPTPNGFLRVREDASLTALEVARVSPGQTFDLLEESTGWYKIKLDDKTIGWVSSQYTKVQ